MHLSQTLQCLLYFNTYRENSRLLIFFYEKKEEQEEEEEDHHQLQEMYLNFT